MTAALQEPVVRLIEEPVVGSWEVMLTTIEPVWTSVGDLARWEKVEWAIGAGPKRGFILAHEIVAGKALHGYEAEIATADLGELLALALTKVLQKMPRAQVLNVLAEIAWSALRR